MFPLQKIPIVTPSFPHALLGTHFNLPMSFCFLIPLALTRYPGPPAPSSGDEGRYWDACVNFLPYLPCINIAPGLFLFGLLLFSANLNYINSSKATASQEPRQCVRSPVELFPSGTVTSARAETLEQKKVPVFRVNLPHFY